MYLWAHRGALAPASTPCLRHWLQRLIFRNGGSMPHAWWRTSTHMTRRKEDKPQVRRKSLPRGSWQNIAYVAWVNRIRGLVPRIGLTRCGRLTHIYNVFKLLEATWHTSDTSWIVGILYFLRPKILVLVLSKYGCILRRREYSIRNQHSFPEKKVV